MNLLTAFGIGEGSVVVAVGGGGRTALAYGLVLEAAAAGLPAIVVPAVRSTGPEAGSPHRLVPTRDDTLVADATREARAGEAIALVGAERGAHGEFAGFELAAIAALSLPGGLIAVDGDGARMRWFKAPAAHEPAIPTTATDVVVCVGTEVLGKPLSDRWVHRPGLVSDLANVATGAEVTVDVVARVLLHERGGRKGVPPGARLHALLDYPAQDEHLTQANNLAARIVYGGFTTAVVAATGQGTIHGVVR